MLLRLDSSADARHSRSREVTDSALHWARPAVVAASQGLGYDDGPQQGMDYSVPVLRAILGDHLGMDVTVLYTRYTLARRVPRLAHLADRANAEHAAALAQAATLATELA